MHVTPFYSFCWRRRGRGSRGSSGGRLHAVAVFVAKGRKGKKHAHTRAHQQRQTRRSRLGWAGVAQQSLPLPACPMTASPLPASFPSFSLSANVVIVVVCGLALALLCFFSRLFFAFAFAIHLHVCLRLHQKGCRLLSRPLPLPLLVCLSLLACLFLVAAHDGNGNNDSANETTLLPGKQIFSCIFNFAKYLLPKKKL